MHHRRNRTSRRESKRLEDKAYRQAEKRAMDGRAPQRIPTDSWSYRGPFLPLGDELPSTGSKRSRRKRPKKDRCPVNHTHEWYRERVTEKEPNWRWNGGWKYVGTKDVEYDVKTCIHCWKEFKKRIYEPYRGWRDRPKRLPKRPVRF